MLEEISNIRSVKTIQSFAKNCIDDPVFYQVVLNHLVKGKGKECYNASWILSHAIEENASIVHEIDHPKFIEVINTNEEGGIRRNVIRIWQFAVPDSELNKFAVFELALKLLKDTSQDLAVRVFSITVLERLIPFIPELKDEILFILEREYPNASASYKVRADRFFKRVKRLL